MKYPIIYADPPWTYRDKAHAGKRGVEYKYRCLSVNQIAAFQVPAADNAALFIWATWPMLTDALNVMEHWGFTYKTCAFLWVKMSRRWKDGEPAKLHWGMGNYTRANTEMCLLGVRGKLKRINAGVHQVIISPLEGHSKKPAETRKRIERLMGPMPMLEMFARETGPGWDVFGDQVSGSIKIPNPLIGKP